MDVVLMFGMLVLTLMDNLSHPKLVRQPNERISFMKFIGFPESIADQKAVLYLREGLTKTTKGKTIWNEIKRYLDANGLKIREGPILDATFITADPGQATSNTARGDEANTRKCKDTAWTKKGKKSDFGYKLHH